MEFKTKSGKKVNIKQASVLEVCKLKDILHQSSTYDEEGNSFSAPFECIYKWLKVGIKDFSDKLFKSFTDEEAIEIFIKLQDYYILGEEKASK